ncbi:hypothetical protein VP1G_04855 [Cytospora mali]|uniref:Uncharacterized protein n=1 Tax=Cytospora mali TaxID=578113 RepID=A0A194V0V4_CYTMA|nr:hypothetical protein VP1G_04855 [Valsa mali var. pyri (nom. inval.)]
MANGLDKLEKLFSKRRPAPSRDTTASNIYGSAPSASAQSDPPSSPEPVFPQAPFVRPKANANRMRARNELFVSSPRSCAGTNSSSSRSGSWRLSSSDAQAMSDRPRQSSYSSTASFHIPSRNTSLLARRYDRKPGGLIQLHLPGETKTIIKPPPPPPPPSLPNSPPPTGPPPVLGDTKRAQKCLLEALPIYPAQRFETPPPSDQDEFRFPSPPSARGRLPSASQSHFTPDASPDMGPKRDSLLSVPKTSSDLQRKSISAPPSRRATSVASSAPLLKDDWRDSYVPDVDVNISPKPKSVFQDPPVQEFLTLTDEDIAEIKIKAPSKPPTRLPPPPPVLPPNGRSPAFVPNKRVSTMHSPSLAPDEVAAFQAARIAKKYDFDFLYIVNFWPSHMSHLHRPSDASKHSSHSSSTISSATSSSSKPPSILYSPTSDCATTKNSTPRNSMQAPSEGGSYHIADCCPDSASTSPRSGRITGRLLAGYGLNTLEAPFRLSAKAHRKILREGTDGWIEYRKSDAQENEFARGYARSFYTGSTAQHMAPSPRRSSAPDASNGNSNDTMAVQADGGAVGVRKSVSTTAKGKTGKNRTKPWSPPVNRGIVFAAYRRPRGHGGTVHSSKAELDALEREAETLVELILDFHQGRRRWELYQEAMRASE